MSFGEYGYVVRWSNNLRQGSRTNFTQGDILVSRPKNRPRNFGDGYYNEIRAWRFRISGGIFIVYLNISSEIKIPNVFLICRSVAISLATNILRLFNIFPTFYYPDLYLLSRKEMPFSLLSTLIDCHFNNFGQKLFFCGKRDNRTPANSASEISTASNSEAANFTAKYSRKQMK